jgi:hypothetical protein
MNNEQLSAGELLLPTIIPERIARMIGGLSAASFMS